MSESTTALERVYPVYQWVNALLIGAGVTILLGFVCLFIPPMLMLSWLLLPFGFVCLLVGWVSHALRLSTQAIIETLLETKQ